MSQIGSMPFPTPSRESGFALIATMKSAAIIQGWLPLESLLAAAVFERTGKMREDALALVPLDSRMLTGDVTPDARLWLASGANLLGHVTTAEETIIRRRRREETGPEFYTANPRARTTDPFAIEQRSYDFKALLSYPFFFEPRWDVTQQTWMWSGGFVLFALLSLWLVRRTLMVKAEPILSAP